MGYLAQKKHELCREWTVSYSDSSGNGYELDMKTRHVWKGSLIKWSAECDVNQIKCGQFIWFVRWYSAESAIFPLECVLLEDKKRSPKLATGLWQNTHLALMIIRIVLVLEIPGSRVTISQELFWLFFFLSGYCSLVDSKSFFAALQT